MENAWKVQWRRDTKKVHKTFQGNSPKAAGAIDLARRLKDRGISVDVISVRKAFPPPLKDKKKPWLGRQEPPAYGMMWCPYCVKWREFEYSSIVRGGIVGPELFRCPVCTISVRDYHVNHYNGEFVERLKIASEVHEAVGRVRVPTRTMRRTSTARSAGSR